MKKILLCLVFALFVTVGCEGLDDLSNIDMEESIEVSQEIDEQKNVDEFFEKGKAILEQLENLVSSKTGKQSEIDELFEKSIGYFTKALEINPNADWVWGDYGRALNKKGDFELAIGKFTKAIELNNQRSVYYQWRAEAYGQLGNAELAQQDREIAEKLHSKGLD